MAIDVSKVKIGSKVWFDPGESDVGWANHGFTNGQPIPSRYGYYLPCWTERQKGEATTFMVHESNVQKVEEHQQEKWTSVSPGLRFRIKA